mgnify:FL=1
MFNLDSSSRIVGLVGYRGYIAHHSCSVWFLGRSIAPMIRYSNLSNVFVEYWWPPMQVNDSGYSNN